MFLFLVILELYLKIVENEKFLPLKVILRLKGLK